MSLQGFPPVAGCGARLLLLGSMPGVASLNAQCYYAHPQNCFWSIMGGLCGFAPDLPYARRCAALRRAGIALWDVLGRCRRQGSLDSAIEADSMEVNDFAGLAARLPRLAAVACNGQTAARLYRRHVLGVQAVPDLPLVVLPSTSPAYASLRPAAKARRWAELLAPWLPVDGVEAS